MNRYAILTLLFVFTAFGLRAAGYTVDQIPNVQVADSTQFVSDPDRVLTPQETTSINNVLDNIRATTTVEPVLVVVNSIDGDDIDSFATSLFDLWKIGKQDKDNGLLILVVMDMRKVTIRTGYGLEGVLPDVVCGRIIREVIAPSFRNGAYGEGLLAAASVIRTILSDPDTRGEILSGQGEVRHAGATSELWHFYVTFVGIVALCMSCYVLFVLLANLRRDPYELYNRLKRLRMSSLVVTFISLGMGLPALLIVVLGMKFCRSRRRVCPNCKAKMRKLSEEEDNKYLTPSQDKEERLKSVDYDVWLCDKCGEVDIYPFISKNTPYQECPNCHAKAMTLVADRLIQSPSIRHEGRGVKIFHCANCGKDTLLTYVVPKDDMPVIVPFIGGFGSHGGGGGFGGGGFGGGMTGGGGATGGW